jgi:MFS family permease
MVRTQMDGSRSQMGLVLAAISAPGLLALVWAYLSDRVALLGTRREGYLLVACAVSAAAWVAAPFVPTTMAPLLVLSIALGTGAAIAGPAIDGALVEISRRQTASGRYAALLVGLPALAALIAGFIEGALVQRPAGWTAAFGVAVALAVAISVILAEDRAGGAPAPADADAMSLGALLGSRSFWTIVALATFAVGLQQGLRRDLVAALGPTAEPTPLLPLILALLQLGATAAYPFLSRRTGPGVLLRASLFTQALACFTLLAVERREVSVELPMAAVGLAATLVHIACVQVSLRAAPPGREAFAFTLLTGLPILLGTGLGTALLLASHARVTFLAALAIATLLLAAIGVSLLPAPLLARPDPPPAAR